MIHALQPILEINLKNIRHNYHILCQTAAPAEVGSVVKANSYGLGAKQIAKTLYEAGCRIFFVAYASEGKVVRPEVGNSEIFVLQGISEDDREDVIKYDLTPVLASPDMLRIYKGWHLNKKPALQVETGLNRLGFRWDDLMLLSAADRENVSMILSHLACADIPGHSLNKRQLNQLEEIKKLFPGVRTSLSASGGIFLGQEFFQDVVRPGAALYGLRQNFCPPSILPVIQLTACIAQITQLKAGQTVSYGATFTASRDMKIAIVSFGYADGFPWLASMTQRGKVWIHGQAAPVLGRVAMDSIMCDISAIDQVKPFDRACIVNTDYTLDKMVADMGTLSYELLTRFAEGQRTQKKYVEEFSDIK